VITTILRIARVGRYRIVAILLYLSSKLLRVKNYSLPGNNEVEFILKSGLVWNLKLNHDQLETLYHKSSNLIIEGHYYEGVNQKKAILEFIYEQQGVDFENHYPPILHDAWFENIGHISSVPFLSKAAELGIVKSGYRYAIDRNSNQTGFDFRKGSILNAINLDIGMLQMSNYPEWHYRLSLSPLFERAEIVKGVDRFYEKNEFLHSVLKELNLKSESYPIVEMSIEYEEYCAQYIYERFGIDCSTIWFCALHVRASGNKLDPKLSKLNQYYPAIYEIIERGGYVFRFGVGMADPLPSHPRIVDFSDIDQEHSLVFLHPYIISRCKFLLTSHSGPRILALGLHKPILSVNLIALGYSLFPGDFVISLPKHYLRNGKEMSLREILDSRFGFSEMGLDDFARHGIDLQENSSDEIHQATIEMLDRLDISCYTRSSDSQLIQVFKTSNAISRGSIATSFLDRIGSEYLM
jgi:putative glycosyltransferase (TIGR04372 family)